MMSKGLFYSCLFVLSTMLSSNIYAAPRDVIIDADTANEVDDLFAVVRGLIEPSWQVLALNATQWQSSQWATPETMEDSHRLNQLLLGHLQSDVPSKRGGHRRMYDWGDKAVHSSAAYEIIKQAHKKRDGKLLVVALGALTNVASALFIDPSIADKIEVFWLGSSYEFDSEVFTTTDFNSVMDIQALHHVLNSSVALTVIPVNVASAMTFEFADVNNKLNNKSPLTDFLISHWQHHIDGGRHSRTIWDLALITTIINPQWASIKAVSMPASFGNRKVRFYQSIDADKVRNDFYTKINAYLKTIN